VDDSLGDGHPPRIEEGDDDTDSGSDDNDHSDTDTEPSPSKPSRKAATDKAAWHDPSEPLAVSLITSRLRKLRNAPSETVLTGREYESRLRRQFERINPVPEWAAKARKDAKEKIPENEEEEEEGDAENPSIAHLLTNTSGIVSSKKAAWRGPLKTGTIQIERLRDVNHSKQASNSGQVKAIAFHPSTGVPVLAVGTNDRRVRLYNVCVPVLISVY
jgi:U3 small nucleolar RNA-associated protein 18